MSHLDPLLHPPSLVLLPCLRKAGQHLILGLGVRERPFGGGFGDPEVFAFCFGSALDLAFGESGRVDVLLGGGPASEGALALGGTN